MLLTEDFPDITYRILLYSISILFFFESTILLLRGKSHKGRRILAYILIFWGILYFFKVSCNFHDPNLSWHSLLRIEDLFMGYLFITLTFLYPVEIILPGWLNLKKILFFLLPFILLVVFYQTVLTLLGQTPIIINSYEELAGAIPRFNVWFRLLLLIFNCFCMISIIHWLSRYKKEYSLWRNENYTAQEHTDINWMKNYTIMTGLNFLLYLVMLLSFSDFIVLLLMISVAISFSYLYYKALFTESIYPENYFSDQQEGQHPEIGIILNERIQQLSTQPKMTFESKKEDYLKTLRTWMETEKPFLYKDFKLMDVSRVLPLNRSYLSRVFNDGYGKNFSEVVRSYRIEYSILVMKEHPELALYQIAELCGFSSSSIYITAFKQEKGITPLQYKSKMK